MSRLNEITNFIGTDITWQLSMEVSSNLSYEETMIFLKGIIS